jgi:type III secretion protein J
MRHRTGAVLLVLLCACADATLHQGLEERAANEIVAELAGQGFNVTTQPEGGRKQTWSVRVAREERTGAIQALVKLGLPRQKQASSDELLKPGIVPSPAEERQLHTLALQGDLARTLEQLEGVHSARVHLALAAPVKAGQGPGSGARCAVMLRVKGIADQWPERRRQDVRALMAGSVDGLGAEQVTLVLDEVGSTVSAVNHAAPQDSAAGRRVALSGLGLAALCAVAWSSGGGLLGWIAQLKERWRRRGAPAPAGGTPRP